MVDVRRRRRRGPAGYTRRNSRPGRHTLQTYIETGPETETRTETRTETKMGSDRDKDIDKER